MCLRSTDPLIPPLLAFQISPPRLLLSSALSILDLALESAGDCIIVLVSSPFYWKLVLIYIIYWFLSIDFLISCFVTFCLANLSISSKHILSLLMTPGVTNEWKEEEVFSITLGSVVPTRDSSSVGPSFALQVMLLLPTSAATSPFNWYVSIRFRDKLSSNSPLSIKSFLLLLLLS